ncbi:MAG: hypothetical protein A2005_09190 [Desulfuromonadales bacterium GWC2_61_20]|nr:MAG: hypothetical protein A2005_09190 [Desulfuromonadales bacterium GWC2_61_20]OGW35414.1 MAG: hypothetical protein A2010_11110 [Nitrospirae bacterium GWD2_57_9]HAD04902.1 hypothetical protein [Desulfuromonas sp.]HBT82036.1 hypothetical protein [Desulfuromonas sp.]
MKTFVQSLLVAGVAIVLTAGQVGAEDKLQNFPVKHALASAVAKDKLDKGIKTYMMGQSVPGLQKRYRAYKSNKRGNAVGKSTQDACDIAFISALIALQQRADKEGGNAVVDIYSLTKDKKMQSSENYSCNAGGMIANVVLMGTVAKVGK